MKDNLFEASSNILFFDVETTGKADMRRAASVAQQPRIVELGALLTTSTGTEIESFNCILQMDGIRIPKEATDIHGITDEIAAAKGVPRRQAMSKLAALSRNAGLVVGYNIDFDSFLVEIEVHHLGRGFAPVCLPTFCAMRASTPICKIPSPYYEGQFKWPKLEEAYRIICKKELSNAHSALADTRASSEIYFAVVKPNQNPEGAVAL